MGSAAPHAAGTVASPGRADPGLSAAEVAAERERSGRNDDPSSAAGSRDGRASVSSCATP